MNLCSKTFKFSSYRTFENYTNIKMTIKAGKKMCSIKSEKKNKEDKIPAK